MTGQTETAEPRPLIGYCKLIHSIDPTINAVGVECSMRNEYGTLDHLPRETFAAEITIARGCERHRPGCLRELADSFGRLAEYDEAEAHVSRIVRPAAPALAINRPQLVTP